MAKITIGLRVEGDLADRLDRIAAELARRSAGVESKRSDVARAAMERGVQVIERELGLAPTETPVATSKGTKPARKPAK